MKIEKYKNKIIQGDCLEVMKEIEDESVDLVVTSPPYNVGIDYDSYNDSMSVKDYFNFTNKWINLLYSKIKKGGRICINIPILGNNQKTIIENKYLFYLPKYLNLISLAGFKIRECITWIKSYKEYDENSFCGGNTAWGSWKSPSCPYCRSISEFIIIAHKKTPKLQHKGETDLTKREFMTFTKNVWFFPSEKDRSHPAPFPIELPRRCIKMYSYKNDLVLDPFIGSGSTAVACRNLDRNYIGIEISEKYCKIARDRLRQKQLNL